MANSDLTEKRLGRAEKKVRILEDMIENLTRELYMTSEENRNLEVFASTASHDLKAPLNSIRALTEMARNDKEISPMLEKVMEMIDQSSSRMARLIDALLEFSKLDSPLDVIDVNSNQVVAEVLIDLKKPIDDSGAEISIEELDEIKADRALFRLLIQNLLSNAIKFVERGTQPKINISSKREGTFYQFSVSDNGVGISPELRMEAFQILKRLNTEYEGVGIGLATCRKVVKKHGGEIWIENNPGGGSVFNFSIPVVN